MLTKSPLAVLKKPKAGLKKLFKIIQVNARQAINRLERAVYMGVKEHFETIHNAVLWQLKGFITASKIPETPSEKCSLMSNLRPVSVHRKRRAVILHVTLGTHALFGPQSIRRGPLA